MIFATVGTQLPFPRLIDALDALAPSLTDDVVAQVGAQSDAGGPWTNLDVRPSLAPAEFDQLFAAARVVVAHAGIGTLLSAKRHARPLVILPRRHALGEHRNDHQLATARQVETVPGVHVAWDTEALATLLRTPDLAPCSESRSPAQDALIARLKAFIDA